MADHISTPADDPRFAVAGPNCRNQRSEDEEWRRREEFIAMLKELPDGALVEIPRGLPGFPGGSVEGGPR